MNDADKKLRANLEFFISAIIEPTFLRDLDVVLESRSTVSDLAAIEVAHWAWLGVRIGYFEAGDTLALISSLQRVWRAWTNLTDLSIISPDDDWARVIRRGEGERLVLNTELFSVTQEIAPSTQALLHSTFQTFLLLTTENILDAQSSYFLDSIAWSDPVRWHILREGATLRNVNSAQTIGFGFANVLNYWSEMHSTTLSVLERSDESSRKRTRNSTFSAALIGVSPIWNFLEDARLVMSRRFNLSQIEVVERYLVLAGEFTKRAREDSPAWVDARFRVFREVLSDIWYISGTEAVIDNYGRLWNSFTKAIEGPLTETEPRQTEREQKHKEV
jgi:hypothetical protein